MREKLLNRLLLISTIVFVFAVLVFVYFYYLKPKPLAGLKIFLKGPEEVLALEDYDYQIQVENGSNQKLKNVSLKISLSQGIFNSQRVQEKESSFFLGDLEPKQKYENKINLFFLNGGNEKETITLTLNYKIGDKNYVFSKESTFSILVKNNPIQIQISLPTKIYLNQQFQTNFHLTNITNKKLDNVNILIELPSNYLLNSSFPASENLVWSFPSFDSKESKNIVLIGQMQSSESLGIFSIKINFEYQGLKFSLPKEIAKVEVLENPVVFNIKSQPAEESIRPGSTIFYEVTIENKSQTTLENCEVKVTFEGPLDISSLNTDGYFNEIERAIYWNSRNKNELLAFKPGDKTTIRLSIGVFQSYPILGEKAKNFSTKMKIDFKTPSIPAEVEIQGKEYTVSQIDEKKIIGDITIEQALFYQDKYFPGEGPFPLENNQPTTLTWHLYIKTIGEDFESLVISTRLPMGVNLTEKVAGDAVVNNLKYDPRTGSFLYYLNNVPANLGYTEEIIDLAFQIIVEVPGKVDPKDFIIIPEVQYSARSSFTKVQINKSTKELKGESIIYQ